MSRTRNYSGNKVVYTDDEVPFLCRDRKKQRTHLNKDGDSGLPYWENSKCTPELYPELAADAGDVMQSLVPYNSRGYSDHARPLKRSMSFLTTQELFSYRAIPALGVVCFFGTAIGTVAHHETFENWFGSEYAAINLVNGMTVTSMFGTACYMYGRRHIRHAGAFQRIFYPCFGSIFFNCASHFGWAFIKELMRDQESFDHHWRCTAAVLSGALFLYTGRSYLNYVDHW